MSLELLVPIDNEILIGMSLLPKQVLGNKMDLHTQSSGLPDLKGLNIAIIGLHEYRNSFFQTLNTKSIHSEMNFMHFTRVIGQ